MDIKSETIEYKQAYDSAQHVANEALGGSQNLKEVLLTLVSL